jgi:hypothetical protein
MKTKGENKFKEIWETPEANVLRINYQTNMELTGETFDGDLYS